MRAKLSTDGGSRGNPGPAAYAYVLEADDGTVLAAHGEAIGVATNNVAEYSALIAGLEKAVEVGVSELEVISDSELMVKQMRGEYKVKNEALRELSLRGVAARARARIGQLHGGSARAQQARRPARERGARRRSRRLTAAILAAHADVAQLARASACHAEGRGFESHHPLSAKAPETGVFVVRRETLRLAAARSFQSASRPRPPGPSDHRVVECTRRPTPSRFSAKRAVARFFVLTKTKMQIG